jgi:homoserine dehydrogenase
VGNISLIGPGAGEFPTASAVIEDLLHLYQEQIPPYFSNESESTDQQEEMGQWLIFKHQGQLLLPQTLDKVEHLSEQVLYVGGKEVDLKTFENEHPDVNVYPIEGVVQFSKELVLS